MTDTRETYAGSRQAAIEGLKGTADPYLYERFEATAYGFKFDEYRRLLQVVVASAQLASSELDDPTGQKGNPLEALCTYLLQQGGLVTELRSIQRRSAWQVDGQGELRTHVAMVILGRPFVENFGPQIYLEAKNHKAVLTSQEFGQHCHRMETHDTRLGIIVSVAGFGISRGLGIADEVWISFRAKQRAQLLLCLADLHAIADEEIPPLAIIRRARTRLANDQYRSEKATQKLLSARANNELASRLVSNANEAGGSTKRCD